MSDDDTTDARIERAARAHRAERTGRSDRASETRARVLATHHAATRRTRTLWLTAAAAALVLLGVPTAWAWSTGRLTSWLTPHAQTPAPRAPMPTSERVDGVGDGAEPSEERGAPATEEVPALAPSGIPEGLSTPEHGEARAVSAESSPHEHDEPEATETEPAPDPRERRAFQRADALHTARDFTAALEAWDAYLAEYPEGRFAIEARYERALCLVRLGRTREASAALTPFAEGRHGRYREGEARALLDALADEAPQP